MIVTRFAPSPTGRLHLGHAASAFFAYELARREGGRFLLRIEDIDSSRCRAEYVDGLFKDLRWLGLSWEEPVRIQSEHLSDYETAIGTLREAGLLYPCFCTRKEIAREAAISASAPHPEEGEGLLYPGTCRNLAAEQREERARTRPSVWRLDMAQAAHRAGPLRWYDHRRGWIEANPARFGDVVLARKDMPTSYHLSVTLDDAIQGVTLVTRGEDLVGATDIHVLLQRLLGLPTPAYHHHPLLRDEDGKRLAKRDKAATIQEIRESGKSAESLFKDGPIQRAFGSFFAGC